MSKIFISDQDFSQMCQQLCSQIFPHKDNFQWVVGIKRGVPPHVWFGPHVERWIHTPFLLVDDIVDSGETLDLFRELTLVDKPKFWVATLHWCEENSPCHKPDYFVETKKKSEWIVYPWEKDEERPQQVAH